MERPQKITFTEMRSSGVRGLLCSDYHCSHWTAISGDQWPDEVRLSDLEYMSGKCSRESWICQDVRCTAALGAQRTLTKKCFEMPLTRGVSQDGHAAKVEVQTLKSIKRRLRHHSG